MESKVVRTSPRSARCTLLALGLASLAAGVLGCDSRTPAVTGFTVTITMVDVAADQLELAVTTPDGFALAPTLRPTTAGAALPSPQSVTIFLPDALATEVATCTVTPMFAGQPAGATVAGSKALVLHQMVRLPIELHESPHDDGGAQDASAADDADASGTGGDAGASEGSDATGADGPGAKANGQACATDDECDSTLCANGVCCASACGGLCEACNLAGKEGTCAPLPAGAATKQCAKQDASSCGFDGTCDGNGGCRRFTPGVACKAESCQGASYMPASACDGQGSCVAANVVDCTPYICDASAGAPSCLATCKAGGSDCVSPAVCTNGSCGARTTKDNGAGCVNGADCKSGFCADGVCCVSACTGACVACNQAGAAGMCQPVGAGKVDPHAMCKDGGAASCGRNGLCDGASACALYPATTVCAAGSCKGVTLHNPKRCDGKGACQAAADTDCTPYRCDPTKTACFTSCALAAQCAATPRRTCVSNVCQ
jgi:hypothetical protein